MGAAVILPRVASAVIPAHQGLWHLVGRGSTIDWKSQAASDNSGNEWTG